MKIPDGLEITRMFSTNTSMGLRAIIEVNVRKHPQVQRLISAAAQGKLGAPQKRYSWSFLTAADGPDQGKTFVILNYHIDPPHACDFSLVFVDGEHDAFFDEWRAAAGRFILGADGKGVDLQAPIDDLAPGLQAHKVGLGLSGPVTPTA
jgi:hypothetical protein